MGAKQKAAEPKPPRIPVAADPTRLTVGASRVLLSMGGQAMCKQFVQDDRFSGPAYWLEPSGRRVDRVAAEELIAKGRLAPVRDGLFGEGSSQTFERVH